MGLHLVRITVAVVSLAAWPAAAQQPHAQHPPPPKVTEQTPAEQKPKEPIPPVTDADRAAAFPPGLEGHAVHDRKFNCFVLFDHLEWTPGAGGSGRLENTTWLGGDINRLWLRTDGETEDGRIEHASVEGLWGHSFSRWWDVVAGVRQDFRPGDPQTWAAVGIQGLAPYWFEVELTGYVGGGGRTAARLEVEYDLLLTNRLVLQPLVELEMHGKGDPEREIAAGFSSLATGARLRYEIRREVAPYIGVTWDRKLFGTADLARRAGEKVGGARVAFGVRTWF